LGREKFSLRVKIFWRQKCLTNAVVVYYFKVPAKNAMEERWLVVLLELLLAAALKVLQVFLKVKYAALAGFFKVPAGSAEQERWLVVLLELRLAAVSLQIQVNIK